jgi:hypothetical protein
MTIDFSRPDATASGSLTKKFTKDASGVRKMNPEFLREQQAQQQAQQQASQQPAAYGAPPPAAPAPVAVTSLINAATALPIVTSTADQQKNLPEAKVAESVAASVELISDADIAQQVGASPAEILANLERVFAQFEVPVGLLNKLLGLADFAVMEFLVDDSGSENKASESLGPTGLLLTRWQEIEQRLCTFMTIICWVPHPPVIVRFLDRRTVLDLRQQPGEPPLAYSQRCCAAITQEFSSNPPCGRTPAFERIRESLARYPATQPTLRYFFCDGEPDGGPAAARAITQMLIARPNPQQNPFTFLTCGGDDECTWCSECEEAAPFCAAISSAFGSEAAEVLQDQGAALPYSRGLWLLCMLCAAFNPDDLDAIDESVPFALSTLQNLLGYQLNAQEYRYYFDSLLKAQSSKAVETQLDQLKKSYLPIWQQHFQHFVAAPSARHIPAVQAYHAAVLQLKHRGA